MLIKKNLHKFFTVTLLFFCANLYSAPVNQVQEYTLENGMQVFLLEDPSDAQVHIEYNCRAGFSSHAG